MPKKRFSAEQIVVVFRQEQQSLSGHQGGQRQLKPPAVGVERILYDGKAQTGNIGHTAPPGSRCR